MSKPRSEMTQEQRDKAVARDARKYAKKKAERIAAGEVVRSRLSHLSEEERKEREREQGRLRAVKKRANRTSKQHADQLAYNAAYYRKKKEETGTSSFSWLSEKAKQSSRDRKNAKYHEKKSDPDYRKKRNESSLAYYRRNPIPYRARTAAYHRQRRRSWSALPQRMKDMILDLYQRARLLTETTGVPHEVDHIVPLKGRQVCGLHVPWNLRIVTRTDNRSKGSKVNLDDVIA